MEGLAVAGCGALFAIAAIYVLLFWNDPLFDDDDEGDD